MLDDGPEQQIVTPQSSTSEGHTERVNQSAAENEPPAAFSHPQQSQQPVELEISVPDLLIMQSGFDGECQVRNQQNLHNMIQSISSDSVKTRGNDVITSVYNI